MTNQIEEIQEDFNENDFADISPSDESSDEFFDAFGYYPDHIYCLVTGKRIGVLTTDEFGEVLDQLDLSNHLEDLRFKVLASMRPGMKWNKMRTESLDDMRKLHPVETMAWLLNRLFMPAQTVTKPLAWDIEHENRIQLFTKLESFHANMQHIPGNAWDQVFLRLLELHAKFDLKSEVAPFTCEYLLSLPLESFMMDTLSVLTPWYERRLRAYLESLDRAELLRTNPMARRAFLNTFSEIKPQTETQIVRAKKTHENNIFGAILDELLGDTADKPEIRRPAEEFRTKSEPVPTTLSSKMPFKFGVR